MPIAMRFGGYQPPASIHNEAARRFGELLVQTLGDRITTLDPLRARISCLTSHGGLTGVPQVNLPGATVDGLPVGLSILGARGTDAALVAVATAMEASR